MNVRLSDDKTDPRISGCAFMSNGYLVACDYHNNNIKLLDTSWSLKDCLKLSAQPWDVSVIDDNTVIVTIPGDKQIRRIQVFPQLQQGHVIQLDKLCWGVEVSGQEIYVSCDTNLGDGEVRVLDKQGNLKRRLGTRDNGSCMFSLPYYITVSPAGDKIFVAEWVTQTVTCMTVDGNLKNPRGLYCDGGDNVMVFGYGSHNIHVITADDETYGTLLSSQDGLVRPESFAYKKSGDTLEPRYEKTGFLHMRKQRRRSASR